MSIYSSELNTIILIALLKEHNINKVIVSPGTTNIAFVRSVQNDSWFNVISAIDERSAAFMACGLADASQEPVVLSCTGATASRNYLPGLTEAYYRKLPVLAVTSSQNNMLCGSYTPQFLDRTNQFCDLVKYSVQATVIREREKNWYITQINKAILEMTHNENGPVHINLETSYSDKYVAYLPKVRKISRIKKGDFFPDIKENLKVAVFIGTHALFTSDEEKAIDLFCAKYNAIVICDQTSNYRGEYRYLANLANQQCKAMSSKRFDLIIHLGSISGAYIPLEVNEVWRVNPDGEIRDYFGKLTNVFQMKEKVFFDHYSSGYKKEYSTKLINIVNNEREQLLKKIGELPFSNIWIAKQLENGLPKNAVLHLAILNSLRSWNIFETDKTVACYSNTGGFGIDGCMSSFLGAAKSSVDKEFFCIIGDLSFFYDINSLLNDIPSNIHILLINNGVGTEFKNYTHPAASYGKEADPFIAAKGHNGFKSPVLVKHYAEKCGLKYLSATNKNEFNNVIDFWLKNGKVILEVFTSDVDESLALECVNCLEMEGKDRIKKAIKKTEIYRIIDQLRKGRIKSDKYNY